MRRIAKIEVAAANAGIPVAEFLATRFTYHSREEWTAQIDSGAITVNGAAVRPEDPLAAGAVLEYAPPAVPEPPADLSYTVLADDPDFIIVDKSGNLPCHPAGRYFRHTLWALLKERQRIDTPVFVHRLDRETSGVVVVAKNATTARALSAQFERREIRKEYLAMVEGEFPQQLNAEGWLCPDTVSAIRKKRRFVLGETPPCPNAEPAATVFRREAFAGGISLVRAIPHTGRTHQIRATLYSLGFPVVGDKLYGRDESCFLRQLEGRLTDADRRALRLDRQALHSALLRFRHPRNNNEVTATAPAPTSWHSVMPIGINNEH
ncbi:MAG: RluA family pseudouridine synthase [Kiritimatiellae bacterium]|nr:RluA family pseudouridine synthase [Kiritimatiellia bacterium]